MSNIYALLIGINYYLPNRLPNGLYYKSLWGCVQDVNKVHEFLHHSLEVPDERIIKLTSTNSDGPAPPEPAEQWPTYKNIVEAFVQMERITQPGDQIYIHYSGHGGRAATTPEFHELKGPDGIDEVLVPMDLGNSEGNYVRDIEIHYLLKSLVDQDRLVTIVLDSCHAGGATRAPLVNPVDALAGVRGLYNDGRHHLTDETPRSLSGAVATAEQLRKAWTTGSHGNTRSVQSGGGWQLEPEGYVLLAACRASEYANEYPFNGKEKNGALSYWLLDSFRQMRPGFTYRMLHDRILAKVHGQFVDQTPQIQGEVDRIVFGRDKIVHTQAVTVIKNDAPDQIVLNAGQAHDVRPGSKFNVFALYETNFADFDSRIAVVEVTEAGATSSIAKLLKSFGDYAVEPGCKAVLFDRGNARVRRRVRLTATNGATSNDPVANALTAVEQVLTDTPNSFIQLAVTGESADYVVTIKDDCFAICDSGGLEILNLYPEIHIEQPDAAETLVARLVHLAKYFDVRELDNDESHSPLADKLLVELTGSSDNSNNDIPTVKDGEIAVLRVHNASKRVLNVSVLNLQPDWGITQIYPQGGDFEPVDPGKGFKLPLRVRLPEGLEEATDVIKVFATVETTSFRWFELPPLLSQTKRALGEFLSDFASDEAMTRNVEILAAPELEWTVRQVEMRLERVNDQTLSSTHVHDEDHEQRRGHAGSSN